MMVGRTVGIEIQLPSQAVSIGFDAAARKRLCEQVVADLHAEAVRPFRRETVDWVLTAKSEVLIWPGAVERNRPKGCLSLRCLGIRRSLDRISKPEPSPCRAVIHGKKPYFIVRAAPAIPAAKIVRHVDHG